MKFLVCLKLTTNVFFIVNSNLSPGGVFVFSTDNFNGRPVVEVNSKSNPVDHLPPTYYDNDKDTHKDKDKDNDKDNFHLLLR